MVIEKMRQTLLSIERIKRNTGGTQWVTRSEIARSLGVSLGTVENLIRERVKSIPADLAIRINQLRISTIEAELARLEKERLLAIEFHRTIDPHEMAEGEALLEAARTWIRKVARKEKIA